MIACSASNSHLSDVPRARPYSTVISPCLSSLGQSLPCMLSAGQEKTFIYFVRCDQWRYLKEELGGKTVMAPGWQ